MHLDGTGEAVRILRDQQGRFALGGTRHELSPLERYEVDENGCWVWLGSKNKGYGRCKWQGEFMAAHRLFYLHHVGPIPSGREVHHVCRNRGCVNPLHLRAVTRAENTQDGASAKLTPDAVQEIRRVMDDLCEKYDVVPETLAQVASRKNWKNV